MKVYVDELPKDCIDCPCESEYYCNLLNEDVGCLEWGEIHKGCPLKPLADYTKQVRKEVCEEIRKTLFEYLKVNSMEELENLSLLDSTLTYDVITDKLDQIQGETKNAETK